MRSLSSRHAASNVVVRPTSPLPAVGRCVVEFTWDGSDEMGQAVGHGWAELQGDGCLEGEICLEIGDDIPFSYAADFTPACAVTW